MQRAVSPQGRPVSTRRWRCPDPRLIVPPPAKQILKTQDIGSGPISVAGPASFASGDNVVDDAAIAQQSGVPGPRTVKEFTRDEQFSMFAITWLDHRDIAAYVRAEMADGSWGPWWPAEPIGETGPNGENGTELIYVEPTPRSRSPSSASTSSAPRRRPPRSTSTSPTRPPSTSR